MKRITTIIATIIAILSTLSATSQDTSKVYVLKLSEKQLLTLYNTLETSKSVILTSFIPMNKGVEIINNVDSLQGVIKKEYLEQLPKKK